MGKRGKKLDEKVKADIIRLSKDYTPAYIARHLGLHKSTVRRHIELELEAKVTASRSFQKHNDDVADTLKGIVSGKRSELMHSAFIHFKQECPEYANINNWDTSKEANDILNTMELIGNSRSLKFCGKCPICHNLKRRLRESSRGVAQLFTNSRS